MVSQIIIMGTQCAVSLVCSGLQRLDTLLQISDLFQGVVELVERVLVETRAISYSYSYRAGVFGQVGELFLESLDPLDRVVGWALTGKHIHQLGHVQSVTAHFWHWRENNIGLIFQLLDLFSVQVDRFLICKIKRNPSVSQSNNETFLLAEKINKSRSYI